MGDDDINADEMTRRIEAYDQRIVRLIPAPDADITLERSPKQINVLSLDWQLVDDPDIPVWNMLWMSEASGFMSAKAAVETAEAFASLNLSAVHFLGFSYSDAQAARAMNREVLVLARTNEEILFAAQTAMSGIHEAQARVRVMHMPSGQPFLLVKQLLRITRAPGS